MLTGLSRTNEVTLKWALGILLFTGLGYVAVRHTLHKTSSGPGECSPQFKKPENLTVGDFQRPLDREFLAKFMKWDETRAAGWIDGMILLPFYDDVAKRQLSMGAVELTGTQRKDILRLVEECADILDMPVPRVYIQPQDRLNALAGGFVDPVLVLDSRFLNENWNERQLRALIGHSTSTPPAPRGPRRPCPPTTSTTTGWPGWTGKSPGSGKSNAARNGWKATIPFSCSAACRAWR
jgi:hypothetical protein